MMKGMNMMVKEYIQRSWDNTVRTTNGGGEETLISLPHPYTVPCADGAFQELYYWDTYFTNRGLLLSGREELVLSNLKNFAYLINTYGFIPNGNRTYYLPEDVDSIVTKVEDRRKEAKWKGREI